MGSPVGWAHSRHLHSKSLSGFWVCSSKRKPKVPPASNQNLRTSQGACRLHHSETRNHDQCYSGPRRVKVTCDGWEQEFDIFMVAWETYMQNPQVMLVQNGARTHVETCHGCMSVPVTWCKSLRTYVSVFGCEGTC